jgi:uncharacterized membrane protein YtjA (UPF0391 family)
MHRPHRISDRGKPLRKQLKNKVLPTIQTAPHLARNLCAFHRGRDLRRLVTSGENLMLYYAVVFFVIALIAGVLGFGGIAGAAAGIAKILFFVFLILFVVSLIMGRRVRV